MKRISQVMQGQFSLIAIASMIAVMPFVPGCFCVEDTTTGVPDSLSREYEGYMFAEESATQVIFKLSGLIERGAEGIEAVITIPGDTTEYAAEDIVLQGRSLSFTATIPPLTNLPLAFETGFDSRFLAGTFATTGGTDLGPVIGVSVGDMPRTEFDMTGAYELVTASTGGDTLSNVADSVAVRLEFERDGTFRAISQLKTDALNAPPPVVETGTFRVLEDYLVISMTDVPEEETFLPISIRGYIVNKDLYILSSPRPFPGYDALVTVGDGIQIEHFKQVI